MIKEMNEMAREIYEIYTTDGMRFGIGVFDNGVMLASTNHGQYKTRAGAQRKLNKLNA